MHSLMSARPGHLTVASADEPAMSPTQFLREALAAIKKRRGLIHGAWDDGGRVCALGAFGKCHDGAIVPGDVATELQAYNDSMPKATPETRRKKVIAWIQRRLKELSQ